MVRPSVLIYVFKIRIIKFTELLLSLIVRHPRPVRESSCPTWSFLPVAWFLPDWRFPFLRLRLRSSSPWPPFILSLGRDVSGSAEPALVLYALGTEHLPRCSHMDAILRFVRESSSSVLNRVFCASGLRRALVSQFSLLLQTGRMPKSTENSAPQRIGVRPPPHLRRTSCLPASSEQSAPHQTGVRPSLNQLSTPDFLSAP